MMTRNELIEQVSSVPGTVYTGDCPECDWVSSDSLDDLEVQDELEEHLLSEHEITIED